MVDTNKDDKLDSEIAKRLDDLFGEGEASSDKSRALKADDPIEKKKNLQINPRHLKMRKSLI